MNKPATLKVTRDLTEKINKIIDQFKNNAVLVGIPASDTNREKDADGNAPAINNATLLAINNFGSPVNNIPPRPVMEIGIRNAQDAIVEQFKKSATQAFSKGSEVIDEYYNKAGSIAANSIKKAINDQEGFPPPSEATLAARAAIGFKGTKALIHTGQMRNAITWVLVKKGGV